MKDKSLLLLQMKILIPVMAMCIFVSLGTSAPVVTYDPIPFMLNKAKVHDVVLLGTTHHCPPILRFIAQLLPQLSRVGVTHIGLEIATDQQAKIDSYMKEGKGLQDIEIFPPIDCPEYRHLLEIIRTHDLKPVALDLPRSMWKTPNTRDQWMAKTLESIFEENHNSTILVIVGNLHTIKKVEWSNPSIKDGVIRSYLSNARPDLSIFSVAECIDDSEEECDFRRVFGGTRNPIAVETKGLDFKLGTLSVIAAKPMTAREAVDAVIVYGD